MDQNYPSRTSFIHRILVLNGLSVQLDNCMSFELTEIIKVLLDWVDTL